MKKTLSLLLCVFMMVISVPQMRSTVYAQDATISYIKLNTEVNPMGDYPVSFELTLSDPSIAASVQAEDFVITGRNKNWLGQQSDFTMPSGSAVTDVSLNGNVLTLKVGTFPERYYNMVSYTVTCAANPALTFTMNDVDEVVTPGLDRFDFVTSGSGSTQFNYYLYTPANADEGPLPLVLFSHGMSDRWALQANRWAITFAEQHNQSKHPSYVLAPQYERIDTGGSLNRANINSQVAPIIQSMIDAGKVDPNRVYVVGKSMGGADTYRWLNTYNDMFAAALPACAANYTFTGGSSTDFLRNIPLWIVYSEGDSSGIVNFNRNVHNGLVNAGAEAAFKAKRTELSVEQVDARRLDSNHAIELFVTESDQWIDWLYAQTKAPVSDNIEYAKAFASVNADGQFINSIQLLVKEGVAIPPEMSFTINGNPVTYSVDGRIITLAGLALDPKEDFTVTGPEGFSFGKSGIRDLITETVDRFIQYSAGMSNGFNYDHNLFVPPITPGNTVGAREKRPLIVVLSKADDNLRDNRIVIGWAEQTEIPAYVLAPSMNSDGAIGNTLKSIDYYKSANLITDVYVVGDDAEAIEELVAAYPDAITLLEVSASPEILWPANHKYVTVTATVNASDIFGPDPTITLVSVTSNEPDDGEGDGDTMDDIVIVDDFTFRLRAERSGIGTGRIYTITYMVTGASGNPTTASATVRVPLSMGKGGDD